MICRRTFYVKTDRTFGEPDIRLFLFYKEGACMTRGRLAIFLPSKTVLMSTEFNGDMYYSGNGKSTAALLTEVQNAEDFRILVQKVNEQYGYEEELVYALPPVCFNTYRNMLNDYYDKWFSDYVFIKNLSSEPLYFALKNDKRQLLLLDNDDTVTFYFGDRAEDFDREFGKSYTVVSVGDFDFPEQELEKLEVKFK